MEEPVDVSVAVEAEPTAVVEDTVEVGNDTDTDSVEHAEQASGKLIVCVKFPETANDEPILAHTEGMTEYWYLNATEKLLKRMKGLRKQCFYADKKADGTLRLGKYASWQEWA